MIRAEMLQKVNPKAKFGVTKFSDLSEEEFAAKYLDKGLKVHYTFCLIFQGQS